MYIQVTVKLSVVTVVTSLCVAWAHATLYMHVEAAVLASTWYVVVLRSAKLQGCQVDFRKILENFFV